VEPPPALAGDGVRLRPLREDDALAYAAATPDNAGALVLARRLGFEEEGVLRQRAIERGRAVDIVWFGLLRDERPGRPA
jgi:RimJ/RimL family protein N-acetyltransferase